MDWKLDWGQKFHIVRLKRLVDTSPRKTIRQINIIFKITIICYWKMSYEERTNVEKVTEENILNLSRNSENLWHLGHQWELVASGPQLDPFSLPSSTIWWKLLREFSSMQVSQENRVPYPPRSKAKANTSEGADTIVPYLSSSVS